MVGRSEAGVCLTDPVHFSRTAPSSSFAEDCAKNDQYVTADRAHHPSNELHKLPYSKSASHPGNPLYVFCCRVVLGHFVRTQDVSTDMDKRLPSVWSSPKRELALILGGRRPHHALVAETGGRIQRFRELIVFQSGRAYPEYLVAYQRK